MRDLFQRSVIELKGNIERKILSENKMHAYLNFDESLKVRDKFQDKKLQEGYSLCRTCLTYLEKSQIPPMNLKNSLKPAVIPHCLKDLTDLEKQLIVKNLIFIKVRQLPKTRMMAMHDRVINVPVPDNNIAKRVTTLPRTEESSGMINVGIKRKLNMKNYHKYGLINPFRVYKACEYLIRNHPHYKNIKLTKFKDWVKECPNLFHQSDKKEDEIDDDSSDEETAGTSVEKTLDKNKRVEKEAESNDFNSTTCLYPKQPETNMIVNHSDQTKKIKFHRKAKKIYDLSLIHI